MTDTKKMPARPEELPFSTGIYFTEEDIEEVDHDEPEFRH